MAKERSSNPFHQQHPEARTLTVALELGDVAVEPGGAVGAALDAVGAVSLLAEAAGLAAGGGEAAALAVLVDGVDDPVDAGVVADLGVAGIDEDDLVVLHGGVLVDPVGVEDAEVGVLAAGLLLGDGLEVALELEVVDTLVLGLTPDHTAVVLALPAAAADGAADDDVALLGLVAEAVGLVGAGGTADLGDAVALAVLPGADAEEEAERVALLVPPQLFHVLVAAHLWYWFKVAGGLISNEYEVRAAIPNR